jgi:hypothetical protein
MERKYNNHGMRLMPTDACACSKGWDDDAGAPVGLYATPACPAPRQVRARYLGVAVLLAAAYALVFVGQVAPSFTMVYSGACHPAG